jgi:hypothetical protein
MRTNYLKATLKAAVLVAGMLLAGTVAAFGQQQVNLTAGPTTLTLPDGSTVPMWGYSCTALPSGVTSTATCAALNPTATGWSPVVITVPTGQTLQINLTNNLSFAAGTGTNTVPTSLVIVGQLGGGLGDVTQRTTTLPPDHTNAQGATTWPIAGGPGGTPPGQGNRVQSFSTEVAAGATTSLTWTTPRAGTYLLESGTHPSIQGPMGLYGMVVVTTAPAGTTAGTAYPAAGAAPAVTYDADADLLFSEIDPVQNKAVQTAVSTVGFSETMVWSGQPSGCGNPASLTYNQCYPPAVNYTPLYYLVNGVAFSRSNAAASQFAASLTTPAATGTPTGRLLLRLVNAGLRMHVPSIVGSQTGTAVPPALPPAGFSLIAEDGSPLPGVPRVQSEVFMAAGKTYDLMVNGPSGGISSVTLTSGGTGYLSNATPTPGTGTLPVSFSEGGGSGASGTATVVGGTITSISIDNAGRGYTTLPTVTVADVAGSSGTGFAGTAVIGPVGTLPVYDRELSLSANSTTRDGGMLAYVSVNGGSLPAAAALTAAIARPDAYKAVVSGQTLTVSDPAKGVIANDTNVYGVAVSTAPTHGTVTLGSNGTFTYVPDSSWASATACSTTSPSFDSFVYQANGSGPTAQVSLCPATVEAAGGIMMSDITYNANVATSLKIAPPGILSVDKDNAGHPLTVNAASVTPRAGLTLSVDPNGGFNASVAPGTTTASFTYKAQNSQGTVSASSATVTLNFPTPSNLAVMVKDPTTGATISDYRWIIEEDRTYYINPACTQNPPPAGCPILGSGTTPNVVPTLGTNFHTSYMPVVAAGCTGTQTTDVSCEQGQSISGVPVVCDQGNGVCRTTAAQQTALDPSQVHLDPTKRYYISVLPGDAANPFNSANALSGHGMGGAPIACVPTAPAVTCDSNGTFPPVTVLVEPNPFQPAKLSVFVFEDDFPLNGEQDGGGGIDVLSPNEPGLGGFEITLFDDAGGTGDATGQLTHDMFNQPLNNSLAGMIDPVTKMDACPIVTTTNPLVGVDSTNGNSYPSTGTLGITGRIVTCPKYESDGKTLSPLAGQAVIANMMPGRYGVVATPAADRIAAGEEWLQTNTLDGQKAHDSFLRVGEPSFFQEYGPAGYHVSIGFANPKIINDRLASVCNGTNPHLTGANCHNTVTGLITTDRMSRTPDERLYSSGDISSFAFTQCYVSFGDPDGIDFAFTKCASDGTFSLSGLPDGDWRITVFDQWNDMLVDGLSTPVRLSGGTGGGTTNMGQIAMNQWQANIYTTTFFDANGDGVRDNNESGLTLVSTNIRFRDGSYSNFNNTDLSGNAGFNEIFPLFSWYVIETDSTRYKTTGIHVVYDSGGPADGNTSCGVSGTAPCGNSTIAGNMANTAETVPLPANLRVPGAYYCATADCAAAPTPLAPGGPGGSTGRVDPPLLFGTEGWQGFSGQNSFLEFGKKPFAVGENGGIHGEVNYASTRPFDDPQLLLHVSWTPDVPNVTVNLYKEGMAPDGVTPTLTLVDTTKTSSWDDWAQGFRSDGVPNMNCPGQGKDTGTNADLFFFSLYNQPNYLDWYNSQHGGPAITPLPNNSQFKCYDGMHSWNQLQPAPYDGMYRFPSVTSLSTTTGKPTGTNCTICVPNPDSSDPYRHLTPMLPAGKYVVEVVVPPGYELVKEEDKNILIGDNYIAPVTQQFGALASVFILPDQAAIGASYNANNAQNPTTDLGTLHLARGEGDTGSVEQFWPCVGASRIVPDYMSIFPQSAEVAPFAGATRNLCDRKEITLADQTSALAKFYIFSSTHVTAHFTGVITDDFTSEFDPFSPQFGEKFSPANLPISLKDFNGNEIARTYADHWGAYDGLNYSTWEVNPPNPTGYAPTMMVTCMNDPGPIPGPNGTMITDPLFNQSYSQFCYEIPFMPGQTQYMDTPVVPTSAFAGAGYNNPDCDYPDLTPAIAEVDGAGVGPWIVGPGNGHPVTITALGDQMVNDYGYSGPSATVPPFNQKKVNRHYGFGIQCTSPTAGSATCNTLSSVTIGGQTASIQSWTDSQIVVSAVPANVPQCALQQQAQYGGPNGTTVSTAKCGEIVITAGNGKQSVDTVTLTIGGKQPTHVPASGSIQGAIDAASPGDLIIVDPTCSTGTGSTATTVSCTTPGATKSRSAHNEVLIMWKPVRLQGVGAASSILNANPHPAGKLDVWRRQVNCLFGLALNGTPISATNPYDPNYNPATGAGFSCGNTNGTAWAYFNPYGAAGDFNPQVDRLPLEATVGWDAALNGNLAEMLQEPSLMGALEGAAITVLSKGVKFSSDPFDTTLLAGFPTGTTLLTAGTCGPNTTTATNPFPSSFWCNPSSIDGLGITDSSQGGGGVFVHGWGHNLQIANNRINNNTGTLSGGIDIGQGEFPGAYTVGGINAAPGSCETGAVTGAQLPYCHNLFVNVHHNSITLNSSIGDELFSATPAGAGGVSFCTGSDYYKFNYNWVCGNLSTGDGGGLGHLGFSKNGDIEHNSVLFNQSSNPTIASNGGGIVIMGTPDVDPPCGATTDADCVSPLGTIGPSDGAGPGLLINANLIMGNGAESGSGGGLRLQNINGGDVLAFPTRPAQWYSVNVTNNIIDNNVAGWDGAGISLVDALNVNIVNNTIMSNDTTASSGVLFNTIAAPLASSQGPCATAPNGQQASPCVITSTPQPAGLVSIQNSAILTANFPATITCPPGHYAGTTASNGTCRRASYPILYNDVFWQNRAFNISVGSLGTGTQNQQNVVTLVNGNFTGGPGTSVASQTSTGACVGGSSYWEIGVRGDTGPSNHGSTITLAPTYSVLTDAADYPGLNNLASNPAVVSQYCNGSRVPPENGGLGYQVPPGISDATVPNPIFNLMPAATVDEGNNWININWGPLAMTNPSVLGADGNFGGGPPLGNYSITPTSPAVNYIVPTSPTYALAPGSDFFGNLRKTAANPAVDAGAVELQVPTPPAPTLSGISPASGVRGTSVPVTISGTNLTGATAVTISGTGVSHGALTVTATTITTTFTITPGALLTARNVTVTTPGGTATLTGAFMVTGATLGFANPTLTTTPANTTTKSGPVTVSNTATGATAGAFTFTATPTVVKVGTTGGTFSRTGGTCVSGLVLNPGAAGCTVIVQYAPGTSTAPATAHVTVTGTGLATASVNGPNFTAN